MSESAESDHLELYVYAGLISVAVVAGLISLDYYSLWTCPERDIAFQYEFTLEISEAQDGGWDICLPDSSHSFSDDELEQLSASGISVDQSSDHLRITGEGAASVSLITTSNSSGPDRAVSEFWGYFSPAVNDSNSSKTRDFEFHHVRHIPDECDGVVASGPRLLATTGHIEKFRIGLFVQSAGQFLYPYHTLEFTSQTWVETKEQGIPPIGQDEGESFRCSPKVPGLPFEADVREVYINSTR